MKTFSNIIQTMGLLLLTFSMAMLSFITTGLILGIIFFFVKVGFNLVQSLLANLI